MSAYKRSIFVINPKFQYKFSLVVCGFILLISLMYPLTIVDLFDKLIAMQPSRSSDFEESRNALLTLLALVQLGFMAIVFVVCIFISHKIAGPIHKLKTYLMQISNGGEFQKLSFRSGDNFTDLADQVNETFEYLSNKRDQDFAYLDEVSAFINNLSLVVPDDKKPVIKEILSKLAQIQSRY